MTELAIAAVQMAMVDDVDDNVATAERLVRDAARQGAQVVLIPELFEGPYFCKDQLPEHFAAGPSARRASDRRALPRQSPPSSASSCRSASTSGPARRRSTRSWSSTPTARCSASTARATSPTGRATPRSTTSTPGDTGFRVWHTSYGTIGVGICWDQWFPESARCMALLGAEVLLYPTAIGSEPPDPSWDSSGHWQRVMQGHAGANLMPLVAANRVGHEVGADDARSRSTARRSSPTPPAPRSPRPAATGEAVLTATFDLDELRARRARVGPVPRPPPRPVRPAAHARRSPERHRS